VHLRPADMIEPTSRSPQIGLVERVDLYRVSAIRQLDPDRRVALGQFLTPPPIARFMASLFSIPEDTAR